MNMEELFELVVRILVVGLVVVGLYAGITANPAKGDPSNFHESDIFPRM